MKTLPRVVTVSAIFLFLASVVQAQVPSASPELVAVNSLPLVFVQNLNVQVGEGGLLSGSFEFINQGTTHVGGITHSLQLLSPPPVPPPGEIVPDNYVVFDRKSESTLVSLGPQQKYPVQFSWQPIAVPAGEYRLRVQASLTGDREVGWADAVITLSPSTQGNLPFIRLEGSSVEVVSKDPITGEQRDRWAPLEGPNVNPGETLTFHSIANLVGQSAVSARITYEVRQILQGSATAQTFIGEQVEIREAAQDIPQTITAAAKPGAYAVKLHLTDLIGTRQSSIAEFRYVVIGPSVSIVSHALAKPAFRKGDTAQVDFTIAGPADRDSVFAGSIEVILLAGERVLSSTEAAVAVGDAASSSGTANLVLQDALCQTPSIRMILRDQDGNEIDRAESMLDSLTIPICPVLSRQQVVGLLAGLVIVAGVLATFIFWLIKRPRAAVPTLLIIFTLGTALAYSGQSEASGIILREGTWSAYINLWVNEPSNGSTISGPPLQPAFSLFGSKSTSGPIPTVGPVSVASLTVPYSARLSWQVCSNSGYLATLTVSALKNGGQASSPYQFSSNAWQQLATTSAHLPGTGISKDAAIYWAAKDLVATLQIPQPPSSTMTTLWTLGTAVSNVNLGRIHDLTWLNLPTPTPTPTPDLNATPTPTPAGSPTPTLLGGPAVCSDGLDNDNDNRTDKADPACHPDDHKAENDASYNPQHTSEVDTECSDTKDNDGDIKPDIADPGCHYDRNPNNIASYDPKDNSELDSISDTAPTPSFDPGGVIEID